MMECDTVPLITKFCETFIGKNASTEHIARLRKLVYETLLKKPSTPVLKIDRSEESMDLLFMQLVDVFVNRHNWNIYDRQYLDECIEDLKHYNKKYNEKDLRSILIFLVCMLDANYSKFDVKTDSDLSSIERCFQSKIEQLLRKNELRSAPEEDLFSIVDWDSYFSTAYDPIYAGIIFPTRFRYTFFKHFDYALDGSIGIDNFGNQACKGNVSNTEDDGFLPQEKSNNFPNISSSSNSGTSLTAVQLYKNKFGTEVNESVIYLRRLTKMNSRLLMLTIEINTKDLIRDIKYLLHGIPSLSFLYSEKERVFNLRRGLYMKTVTPELLSDYCDQFIACANCYVALKKLILESQKKSIDIILQTFYTCVRQILESYEKALFNFEWHKCTLSVLFVFVERLKTRLSFFVEFCTIALGKSSSINGIRFLNCTYAYLDKIITNNSRFLLYYIFKKCFNSYLKIVSEWMFNGDYGLNNQLFIHVDEEYLNCKDRRWLNSFVFNHNLVPHFFDDLCPDVAMCGKLILLLKNHWREESRYKLLIQNRPKIRCIFDYCQLEKYNNEWEEFYRNCSPFFQVSINVRNILKTFTPSQEYYDNIRHVQQKWIEEYERQNREHLQAQNEKIRSSQKALRDSIREFLEMKNAYQTSTEEKENSTENDSHDFSGYGAHTRVTNDSKNDLNASQVESNDTAVNEIKEEGRDTDAVVDFDESRIKSTSTYNEDDNDDTVSRPNTNSTTADADDIPTSGIFSITTVEEEFETNSSVDDNKFLRTRDEALENKRKIMTSQLRFQSPTGSSSYSDDVVKKTIKLDSDSPRSQAARNKLKILSSEFDCRQISDVNRIELGKIITISDVHNDNRDRMIGSSINLYQTRVEKRNNIRSAAMENRLKVMSSEFDLFRSEEYIKIGQARETREVESTTLENDEDESNHQSEEMHKIKSMERNEENPQDDDYTSDDSRSNVSIKRSPIIRSNNNDDELSLEQLENDFTDVLDKSSKFNFFFDDKNIDFLFADTSEEDIDLSIVDFTTVSKYFRSSVIAPLNAQSKITTDAVTILFIEKLRYFDYLTSLKKYFFLLEDGYNFVLTLKNCLFPKLDERNSSASDFQLRCLLEDLTFSFSETKLSLRLDEEKIASLNSTNEKTACIIERVSLHYSIRWPLNILITEEIITGYNKVFKFLLRICWTKWLLQSDFCEMKIWRNCRGQQYRDIQIYRHIMLQLFIKIDMFVQYHIIQRCWMDLCRNFAKNTVNFDTLYTYHKDYADEILRRLLLHDTEKSFNFHKCLSELFHCVRNFHGLLKAECWEMNEDSRFLCHSKYDELQNIYTEFTRNKKELLYSLRHLIQNDHTHFKLLYKSLF